MKKVYLVGMLQDYLTLENGQRAKVVDKKLGVIGLCPVFSSKHKASAFSKGTKFPIITMQIEKGNA